MPESYHHDLGGFTYPDDCEIDDSDLIERIIHAYRHSICEFGNHERTGGSQWTQINRRKQATHAALMSGRGVHGLFRNPTDSNLLEGYESNFSAEVDKIRGSQDFREFLVALTLKALSTMLRNLGLSRLPNPEAPDRKVKDTEGVDEMIRRLEVKLAVGLLFPNPFPGEYGVLSRHGIISIRAVYGLYQAYMTRLLMTHSAHRRVVEIGAGLGRAAYFAHRMGVTDYTIYDLPMTNAAQAYFLGRTLGAKQLTLAGEPVTGSIKILNPTSFHSDEQESVGVVVCVDALTEMEFETARVYIDRASRISDVLYTVNHEVNEFTARQVIDLLCPNALTLQHEHNLRPGYVENIVFNRSM